MMLNNMLVVDVLNIASCGLYCGYSCNVEIKGSECNLIDAHSSAIYVKPEEKGSSEELAILSVTTHLVMSTLTGMVIRKNPNILIVCDAKSLRILKEFLTTGYIRWFAAKEEFVTNVEKDIYESACWFAKVRNLIGKIEFMNLDDFAFTFSFDVFNIMHKELKESVEPCVIKSVKRLFSGDDIPAGLWSWMFDGGEPKRLSELSLWGIGLATDDCSSAKAKLAQAYLSKPAGAGKVKTDLLLTAVNNKIKEINFPVLRCGRRVIKNVQSGFKYLFDCDKVL